LQAIIAEERKGRTREEFNTRSNIEVAKPLVFSKEASKIVGFIIACRIQ